MATTIWRYDLPSVKGEGWGTAILCSDGFASFVTDHGNYAFRWTHHGYDDFREFWLHRELDYPDYLLSKFLCDTPNCGKRYDPTATLQGIKERILDARRDGYFSRESAREEWDHLADCEDLASEGDFDRWLGLTALSDAYEHYCDRWPAQAVYFATKWMARLADSIRAELDAEKAQGAG